MLNSYSPVSLSTSCSFLQHLNLFPPPAAHTVPAHGSGVTVERFPSLSSASESHCDYLPFRMQLLSLCWLGLGPVVISSWHLLLLFVASWLLARILAWTYSFYEMCACLRCFPQAPKRNWFWGHLGTVGMAGGLVRLGGCLLTDMKNGDQGLGGRKRLGLRTAEKRGSPSPLIFPAHSWHLRTLLCSEAFLLFFPAPNLL